MTALQLLTHADKTAGDEGRVAYLRKQREVLHGDVNLVEIDLLRGGTHTTAVPLEYLRRKAPPFDYHVCVHAFDQLGTFAVYTFLMTQRVPSVAIPLLPGDGMVTVDLQAVFQRCYDTGPYRRRVRYEPRRVVPALRPEQQDWATQLLRDHGVLVGDPPPNSPGAA